MQEGNCRLIKNDMGTVFCLDLIECFQDRHKSISPKCFDCPFYLSWEENIAGIDLDSIIEKVKNPLLNKEEIISLITNQPTTKAIPIEWVKKYRNQFETTDEYYNVVDYMLRLWEKENEV